jgi:hypothetical protein
MSDLAARQRELVAALVAGGEPPAGVDPGRFAAAERALRAKRAGEVAAAWPLLAAALNTAAPNTGPDSTAPDTARPGATFATRFAGWARARPSNGALRDGWDFARELAAAGELPELGRDELAARDVRTRYDGRRRPRPRRLPAARRVTGGWLVAGPGIGTRLLRPPVGAHRGDCG